MKMTKISVLAILLILIACKHTQKSASPAPPVAASTPAEPKPTYAISGPATGSKSTSGIFAPGDKELLAMRATYPDITIQTLNEGHAIYTGVCTNCHRAKNIYSRDEAKWPSIIDDMAPKSWLSPQQKDAVLKYVLSIKATQAK